MGPKRTICQIQCVRSAARTVTGNSVDMKGPYGARARFLLAVTAVAGTGPTLNVAIAGKTSNGNYVTIASFTEFTAIGEESILVDLLPEDWRIEWGITGITPSFTFNMDAIYETFE